MTVSFTERSAVSLHAKESKAFSPDESLTVGGFRPVWDVVEADHAHAGVESFAFVQQRVHEAARRSLNVLLAFAGLLLAAPVMLLIAISIKLSSAGPIIYRQTRVGIDRRHPSSNRHHWRRRIDHGGRLFTMYKFRTMTAATDPSAEVWATRDDPRVTAVGRFLRQHRLDELPQLLNVLQGDMNLVGPRPEQPSIFAELRGAVDGYSRRQRVLPGITGWAQINQSYDRCVDDVRSKLRYDLEYIEHQSILTDLRIVFGTVPVMLFRVGSW